MRYEIALKIANEIKFRLEPTCERIEIVGSLRRKKEIVNDIDLLCVPRVNKSCWEEQAPFTNRISKLLNDNILNLIRKGSKNMSFHHVESGIPVDIFITSLRFWYMALVIRTGSKESNINLASHARKRNWAIRPYLGGYQDLSSGRMIICNSECEVFTLVGLPCLLPVKR